MAVIGGSFSVGGTEILRESDGAELIVCTAYEGDHLIYAAVFDPAQMGESDWDALYSSGNRKAGADAVHDRDRGSGVRGAGG